MNNSILILILLILILLVICVLSREQFSDNDPHPCTEPDWPDPCPFVAEEHLAWGDGAGREYLWNKAREFHHSIARGCHKRAIIPHGQSGHPYSHRDYRRCIDNSMKNFANGMKRFPMYKNLVNEKHDPRASRPKWDYLMDEILSATTSKTYGKPPPFGFDSEGVWKPR